MSITAVMVDRARIIERVETGKKVEGTTTMAPVHGPWFKVRLFLDMAQSPERSEQGERKKVVQTPLMMFGVKTLDGAPLELVAEQQVEISSPRFGTAVWRLTADPQPISKKRRVIGGQVSLERVAERPRRGVE